MTATARAPASTTLTLDAVAVGDPLPELTIDVTAGLIVATAIASRDYQNVHHDQDAARELGSPDIFMNILTSNGLVGRFITDWAGPDALLKKISIRLGVPNYPGDRMVMSGEVTGIDTASGVVTLDVKGKNRLGYHITGSAEVALPQA